MIVAAIASRFFIALSLAKLLQISKIRIQMAGERKKGEDFRDDVEKIHSVIGLRLIENELFKS